MLSKKDEEFMAEDVDLKRSEALEALSIMQEAVHMSELYDKGKTNHLDAKKYRKNKG